MTKWKGGYGYFFLFLYPLKIFIFNICCHQLWWINFSYLHIFKRVFTQHHPHPLYWRHPCSPSWSHPRSHYPLHPLLMRNNTCPIPVLYPLEFYWEKIKIYNLDTQKSITPYSTKIIKLKSFEKMPHHIYFLSNIVNKLTKYNILDHSIKNKGHDS